MSTDTDDDDNDDVERKQVTVWVDEPKKEEWEEAADSPEYASMSDLIRTAVRKEIGEGVDLGLPESPGASDGEVLAEIRKIATTLSDMETRLRAVEMESAAGAGGFDVQRAVYSVLPTQPTDATTPADRWDESADGEPADPVEWAETPDEIAGKLGADVRDVENALDALSSNDDNVISMHPENQERAYYWRSE